MKKAGILIITLILVAAMFTGCRRGTTDTTGSSAPATTSSTAKPTTPKTTGTTKPSSGVIPGPSGMMPQPSGSSAPGRNHRSPMR